MTNCPNCGANLKNHKCKHCKSDFTPKIKKQDIKLNIVIDGNGVDNSWSSMLDTLGMFITFIGLVFTVLTVLYMILNK